MSNRRANKVLWLAFIFVGLSFDQTGCTDATLETLPPPPPPEPDDKLSVGGEVCTQDPEDLTFPLRVLFLVDASESMAVNDPVSAATGTTGRRRAVEETAEELLTSGDDVKISVVRFSSETQPLTASSDDQGNFESYFTDDMNTLQQNLSLLNETDRTTNFVAALAEAYSEIRHELTNADQESLALSTYHVILVTDGIPDVEGDETDENSEENLLASVEELMELGRLFHVGHMVFNTALISSQNAEVDNMAGDLLKSMAETGGGSFRSFASGGQLNFVYLDLSALRRVFTLKTLVAQNINAVVDGNDVKADGDGDGIGDWLEAAIGSDPHDPDSDGDGCRDGMEYRLKTSGLDPIDGSDCQCYVPDYCFDDDENGLCDCPGGEAEGSCCVDADGDGLCDCVDGNGDGRCDPSNFVDSDGDGLFDCEERYTGTNKRGADTDGDGLLDFLELRFGTSPDIHDITEDADWDAVTNGEEVKTATDPKQDSSKGRSKIAYRYKLVETSTEGPTTCYDFRIDNITLTDLGEKIDPKKTSGPGGQGYSGHNRILIFAGEVPFDDLESYGRFRVACVEARFIYEGNYKTPPSGRLNITEEDFVSLSEFDPEAHCVTAGGSK